LYKENPWYKDLMDDFRELPSSELPPGVASGCEFTSVCINTPVYCAWLLGKSRANGVVFKRAVLKHISDAALLGPAGVKIDIIVNAIGLNACKLGGVADKNVIPVRGQIVVVRNEAPFMMTKSGTDDDDGEVCYIMTRAAGGGTVVGGTYQKGSWESQPDLNIATRILQRVKETMPDMKGPWDIIRHGVGLRPYREGGVRLEKERIGDTWVVHNYGHGGWGYQGSYGCAERVVELVQEALDGSKS
jgi:D-amino-acid oxidase